MISVGKSDNSLETIQWSLDGKTWEPITKGGFLKGTSGGGFSIAYNPIDNTWVAVGKHADDPLYTIQWSNNGKSWEPITSGGFNTGTSGGVFGVAHNPIDNIWVAAGRGENKENTIQFSLDGKIWQDVLTGGFVPGKGTNTGGFSVSYSPVDSIWVSLGVGAKKENSIQYSLNGKEWKDVLIGGFEDDKSSQHAGANVAYNPIGKVWTAVGHANNGKTILTSYNGKEWYNFSSNSFKDQGRGIAYSLSTGLWIAVGNATSGSIDTVLYSRDGKTWKPIIKGGFTTGYGVTYNLQKNLWVAVGRANNLKETIQWSLDGKIWEPIIKGGFGKGGDYGGRKVACIPGLNIPIGNLLQL